MPVLHHRSDADGGGSPTKWKAATLALLCIVTLLLLERHSESRLQSSQRVVVGAREGSFASVADPFASSVSATKKTDTRQPRPPPPSAVEDAQLNDLPTDAPTAPESEKAYTPFEGDAAATIDPEALVPLKPGTCTADNGPDFNVSFYRAQPRYKVFLNHFKTLAASASTLASLPQSDASSWDREGKAFLHLFEQLIGLPRHNPGGTAARTRWGHNIIPSMNTLGRYMCSRKHGATALKVPLPGVCRNDDALGGHYQDYLMVEDLMNPNALRGNTDPDFKPKVLLDMGARGHERDEYARQALRPPLTLPRGSLAQLIKHYPRATQLTTIAFELDANRFQKSYDHEIERRAQTAGAAPFKFFPGAVWTHDGGLAFRMGDMVNIEDVCSAAQYARRERGCVCVPTVDTIALLKRLPPRSVVLKIDVEYAEWALIEAWIRAGVMDRFGEMFLECHSTEGFAERRTIFPRPSTLLQRGTLQKELYSRMYGQVDCFYLHDLVRSHGVATHQWP